MKYDMERDNRLAKAEEEFRHGRPLRPEETIQHAEFMEMKLRIEWDVAWRIFDHVNENNDTTLKVDLHCLDIYEAESITKQQIYEAARKVQNEGNSGLFSFNLLCTSNPRPSFVEKVLSVQCAPNHIVDGQNKII